MTFTYQSPSRFLPAFDTVLPAGGSSASVAPQSLGSFRRVLF